MTNRDEHAVITNVATGDRVTLGQPPLAAALRRLCQGAREVERTLLSLEDSGVPFADIEAESPRSGAHEWTGLSLFLIAITDWVKCGHFAALSAPEVDEAAMDEWLPATTLEGLRGQYRDPAKRRADVTIELCLSPEDVENVLLLADYAYPADDPRCPAHYEDRSHAERLGQARSRLRALDDDDAEQSPDWLPEPSE